MDSGLPQSKSVPSILSTGRPHRVSISGSGSYQSHLSSVGSLHRVRTNSEQAQQPLTSVDEKLYLHALESGLAGECRPGQLSSVKYPITDPLGFLADDLRRIRSGHIWRLRTILTLYCCLSVVFLSVRIHAVFREALRARPQSSAYQEHAGARTHGTEPLQPLVNISVTQRLSVAFPNLPPPAHLDAFVVQAHYHQSGLTACLWIEDFRITAALESASAWPGPVSLVVVTAGEPNSTEYRNLLGYIATKLTTENLSVHVLHVRSISGGSYNAYVNMARFFAQTSQVILFPDGIPNPEASSHASWLDKLPVEISHPVVLGNGTHKAFSLRPLSPVVLPRDHPVWCTERFYLFGSRTLDWEDCLWQLWLESAGDAASIAVPHVVDGSKNTTAPLVSAHTMKIRLRWSTRYRTEACAFAMKRAQALDSLTKLEKKHLQWRKKFCRETVGPGAIELP